MPFHYPEKPKVDSVNLFDLLWQSIEGILSKVLTGNSSGLLAPFAFLADMMDIQWVRLRNAEAGVGALTDGQLALNDEVELLSPLQDYGSCYAPGSGDLINTGRVPFSRQIGPMTGCHMWPEMNAIVLDSPGLWDIRARLGFSWTIGGNEIRWHIRVVSPQGTIFHQTFDRSAMSAVNHREINTSVVVPDAGYFVEVWIDTLQLGRATLGGPENNRLTVQHITRDTDFQIGD